MDYMTELAPGPVPGVIRRWRGDRDTHWSEWDSDRWFFHRLYPTRPHLVLAVALWDEVKAAHPAILTRDRVEPLFEAARIQYEAAILDAVGRTKVRPGPGEEPPRVELASVDWRPLVRGLTKLGKERTRVERSAALLYQLAFLGWGHWRPDEETGEFRRTAGGGQPQPQWMFSCEPEELDGELSIDGEGWCVVKPSEEQWRPLRGGRRTLGREVVASVWRVLGKPDPGDVEERKEIAGLLPSAWPELHDTQTKTDEGLPAPLYSTLRSLAAAERRRSAPSGDPVG